MEKEQEMAYDDYVPFISLLAATLVGGDLARNGMTYFTPETELRADVAVNHAHQLYEAAKSKWAQLATQQNSSSTKS